MADWSDFNDEVEADSSIAKQGPKCKMCKLLNNLAGEDAEQLEKALDAPMVTATSIRRALIKRVDHREVPSAYSISRHRRGDCRGAL
jgi:hypothetical protein